MILHLLAFVSVAHAEDEPAWLTARVSGVLSHYDSETQPSNLPGPILNQTVDVGSATGSTLPYGIEFDARVWSDPLGIPYVGVHVQARTSQYEHVYTEFAEGVEITANDALNHIDVDFLGRYPVSFDEHRLWVAGGVGFRAEDFLVLEGCLAPGCELALVDIPRTSWGLRAEASAEMFGHFGALIGYRADFVADVQHAAHLADLELSYIFADHISIHLGGAYLQRFTRLLGANSGVVRADINDSQWILKLGVGARY